MKTTVDTHIECAWCHMSYSLAREMLGYKGKYFCDDECLGHYLVDKLDGEIETVYFETPDDVRDRELERKAEY